MEYRVVLLLSSVLISGLVNAPLAVAEIATNGSSPPRPNFVIFMTDDQSPMPWPADGFRSSPPYGYCGDEEVYTPEIDRMSTEGMVFTRAYVSSSVCSPSRYALLTGRLAGRCEGPEFLRLHPPGTLTRVENNTEIESHRPNLATLLRDSGYRTGFVGKCHVVDLHVIKSTAVWGSEGLQIYGKQENPKAPVITDKMRANQRRWCRRLSDFGFSWAGGIYAGNLRELYNDASNLHNIDWTTEAALDFLSETGDQPFLLYYATTLPHSPEPWHKQEDNYLRGVDGDASLTGEGYRPELENRAREVRREAKRSVQERGKSPDHSWLTWLDMSIGRIRKKLEETGQWENTVFLILSDHGSWRHGKTTLYEGGVRVPMLIHWPKGIEAGARFDGLVQNTDITPTFLELAGVDVSTAAEIDGKSLVPILSSSKKPLHDHLFLELGFARGIVTDQWKYITIRYDDATNQKIANGDTFPGFKGGALERPYNTRNPHLGFYASRWNSHYFESDQLFDLSTDPREEDNLINSEPAQAVLMADLLRRKLRSFEGRPFGKFTISDTITSQIGASKAQTH